MSVPVVFFVSFDTFRSQYRRYKGKKDVVDHPIRYVLFEGAYTLYYTSVDFQLIACEVRLNSFTSIEERDTFFMEFIREGIELVTPLVLLSDYERKTEEEVELVEDSENEVISKKEES